MTSKLEKQAQRHAEQVQNAYEANIAQEKVDGRKLAQKDFPEWERRIKRQLSNKNGFTFVIASALNNVPSGFLGFGRGLSTERFSSPDFRESYVVELQALLGVGFRVTGYGAEHGTIITTDLPYPHRDEIMGPRVSVSWGH